MLKTMGVFSRKCVLTMLIASLFLGLLAVGAPMPVYAAVKTFTVDFGVEAGDIKPKTGMLLITDNRITDARYIPLKIDILRDDIRDYALAGTAQMIPEFERGYHVINKNTYDRLNAMNIQYYPITCYMPSWLRPAGASYSFGVQDYPPVSYPLFKQWIKDFVQYAKDNNMNIPEWNVWNEYWGISTATFNLMYKEAWNAIKEVDPNAGICGPSSYSQLLDSDPSEHNYQDIEYFLNYCQANGLTCDKLTWHELPYARSDSQEIWGVPGSTGRIKALASGKPSVGVKKYSIEEYGSLPASRYPGHLVNWFAALEESKADEGIKAIWESDCRGLSDLCKDDGNGKVNARTASWWAMRAYSTMSGKRVTATPNGGTYGIIASKDTAKGKAMILVGSDGSDGKTQATKDLSIQCISNPFAGQNIIIDKYEIGIEAAIGGVENDGIVFKSSTTVNNSPSTLAPISLTLRADKADDVWLIVIRKVASPPGEFCLKAPDDCDYVTTSSSTPVLIWTEAKGATGYNVKVSVNSDMTNPVINANVSGTSYQCANLTAGTKYYWTVTASNSSGSTQAANSVKYSFTVATSSNLPGIFGINQPFNGLDGISTTPQFKWTNAPNATSYSIDIANNISFNNKITVNTTGSAYVPGTTTYTTYTYNGMPLNNDTTYYFKIYANNANGSRLMNGPVYTFITAPAVSSGSFNVISPSSPLSRRGNIKWSKSNSAFYYRLVVSTNSNFSNPVLDQDRIMATSYTFEPDKLAANTTYYWKVTAYDVAGNSRAATSTSSFTTENKPTSPLLKTTAAKDGAVDVYFSTVAGATSYKVKYGESPENYTGTITGVISSPYNVTGLTNGTKYYFAVTAVNGSTESSIFNEKSETPVYAAPAPVGLFEAENAALTGCSTYADQYASNSAGVAYMDTNGDSVTFTGVTSGTLVKLKYATTNNGTLSVYRNGVHSQNVNVASTGAWAGQGAYAEASIPITVMNGDSLKIQFDSGDVAVNIDCITIESTTATKREAENAVLTGCSTYTDQYASNSAGVAYVDTAGDAVTFTGLTAGTLVKLRYASTNNGTLSVYKNGVNTQNVNITSTGAWAGQGAYVDAVISITVANGDSLKIQFDSGDVAANIDYITVE